MDDPAAYALELMMVLFCYLNYFWNFIITKNFIFVFGYCYGWLTNSKAHVSIISTKCIILLDMLCIAVITYVSIGYCR